MSYLNEEQYIALCEMYEEEPQYMNGLLDCNGAHSRSLKARAEQFQRLISDIPWMQNAINGVWPKQ